MPYHLLRYINIFPFILTMLFSCRKSDKNDNEIIKVLQSSLASSNSTIDLSTMAILKDLEEKTTEWRMMEQAKKWFPKAELITTFSRIRYNFIEKKKNKDEFTSKDLNEVYHTLIEYKKEVLGRDSSLKVQFENDFSFINKFMYIISIDTTKTPFSLKKNISKEYFNAILTSLLNEIKKIENKTVRYCSLHVGSTIDWFYSYSAIVGQNSNYIKPGGILEIKAGIGSFSQLGHPIIAFNGKNIPLADEGYSTYKFKVPKTTGNYKVPVKINFFNQTIGKYETIEKIVEYTVAKPCDQ